jgi:Protein of unknown function (DUF732)
MKGIIAALGLSLAVAFAAPVHAAPEDTFMSTLARHGIGGDPQALIGAGHDTCDAMAQGYVASGFLIWKPNGEFLGQGLSYTQTMQAEHDAVNAFCPDKAWWRD